MYFGGGVRAAASCQPLREMLHKAGLPATLHPGWPQAWCLTGDPLNLGLLGMHGGYAANRAVSECDVLRLWAPAFPTGSP